MSSLFDLTGKVALITGSTRGIGKATAERMSEHGARVVISSRKADACTAVATELTEKGREAIAQPANVTKPEELRALVGAVMAKWGRIDILVCNAAVNPYYGGSPDLPESAFDQVIGANVKSVHQLCMMVVPQMKQRRDGVLIAVSSLGGFIGSNKIGIYNVSKAAEMQMMRNYAVEFGPHGIRANSIAPAVVKTDFSRALWNNPATLRQECAGTPLSRVGDPDDIAGIAVFLASRAGAFVTGQSIIADGGRSISGTIPDNPDAQV